MSDSATDSYYSPFDVDLGGGQRLELRSELRVLRADYVALLQAQNDRVIEVRIDGHRWRAVQPVFSAWRRAVAVGRAQRAHASTIANLESTVRERSMAAAALEERVPRIKANAQMKLSELSEANKQLVAALEERDTELKALRRRVAKGGRELSAALAEEAAMREVAAGARADLSEAEQRVARADATVCNLQLSLAHARASRGADDELGVLSARLISSRQRLTDAFPVGIGGGDGLGGDGVGGGLSGDDVLAGACGSHGDAWDARLRHAPRFALLRLCFAKWAGPRCRLRIKGPAAEEPRTPAHESRGGGSIVLPSKVATGGVDVQHAEGTAAASHASEVAMLRGLLGAAEEERDRVAEQCARLELKASRLGAALSAAASAAAAAIDYV